MTGDADLQQTVTLTVYAVLGLVTLLFVLSLFWYYRRLQKRVAALNRAMVTAPTTKGALGRLLDPMDSASGVLSQEPSTKTVEFIDWGLGSVRCDDKANFPIALSKTVLDFERGLDSASGPDEPDVDVTIQDRILFNATELVSFRLAPVSSPKFDVSFTPSQGTIKAGGICEIVIALTPRCTTTIDFAVAVHTVLGEEFEAETDEPVDEGLTDVSARKKRKNGQKEVQHVMLTCELTTALSTKIDFDEFQDLVPAGRAGSYGRVSFGYWREQEVTVKHLRVQRLDDPKVAVAFEKEIVLMSKLKHKNVVTVYGYVNQPGKLAVVTECVEMGGVDNYLGPNVSPKERLSMPLKLKVAWDAAEGMGFLHRCSILHRNMKPTNVLLVSQNHLATTCAKITDFGSSRTMTEKVALAHRIGVGRPAYMAPEILSLQPYSVSSDMYSFGMVLYVLVAEEEPYAHHASHWDVVQAITSGVRPPLVDAAARSNAPPALVTLITSCWQAEAAARPEARHAVQALKHLFKQETDTRGARRARLAEPASEDSGSLGGRYRSRINRKLAREEGSHISDTFSGESGDMSPTVLNDSFSSAHGYPRRVRAVHANGDEESESEERSAGPTASTSSTPTTVTSTSTMTSVTSTSTSTSSIKKKPKKAKKSKK